MKLPRKKETVEVRKMQDPVCVGLENLIEATNQLESTALRLTALAALKRRSKTSGCEGAYLLVHYELLGIYVAEGDAKQVERIRAVVEKLSPKVIARAEREQRKGGKKP